MYETWPQRYRVCGAWEREPRNRWWPCLKLAADDSDFCVHHGALIASGVVYVAARRPTNASPEIITREVCDGR